MLLGYFTNLRAAQKMESTILSLKMCPVALQLSVGEGARKCEMDTPAGLSLLCRPHEAIAEDPSSSHAYHKLI